jgi:hypothetical protein
MEKVEEILIKHCIEMDDMFLSSRKDKALKQKIISAMEEYAKWKESEQRK